MDTVMDSLAAHSSTGELKSHEQRLAYIDTLRGLASVQVLLSHGMLAFFPSIALASPSSRTLIGYLSASPIFFAIDGASAVCVFFILSGYVLTPLFTHSKAATAAIISSRFLRLGIPAIAACAFSAILFQIFGGYHEAAAAVEKVHWLADGWRPDADLWFLKDALVDGVILGFRDSSLIQWLGFPAAYLASMDDSYVTPLWTLSIEFYGSVLILIIARSKSWAFFSIAALLLSRTYLLCFLVGHFAARMDLGNRRLLVATPVATAVAVVGLAVCMTSHFWSPEPVVTFCTWSTRVLPPCPFGKADYLMRVYGASLFTIGVMQCTPMRVFLGRKRLNVVGRLSFPIYLTHWPIIFGIGSFSLLLLMPLVGVLPARVLALFISIFLTIAAAVYFEPIDQIALRVSRAWRRQRLASE
jgi:peptidoglycan/LPS O-acetylase OafA/YrhL